MNKTAMKTIRNMMTIFVLFLFTAILPLTEAAMASESYPVVDTAQEKCYDDNTNITCPQSGASFYGQDAQHTGNIPSYTDNGNSTITDNNTGLMWQKSPDTDGDGDIDAADKLTWTEVQAYPATLNAQNFGGHSDWRVPTIKELYSLIEFSGSDPSGYEGTNTSGLIPFIDTTYFDFAYGDTNANERIIDAQYASNTLYIANTGNDESDFLFGVNFADGRIKGYGLTLFGQDKTFFLICVRGNTDYGINSFKDNGDKTVTDNATGLMWSQEDSGGTGMNWQDALAWVQTQNAANYLGHSDWRMPNAKELQSIADYTRSPDTSNSAAIDSVFTSTSVTNEAGETDYPFYWSSTTHANWTGTPGANAAYVAFGRAMGYMEDSWMDVHGAGAQRSDPKSGDPADYPTGNGPQGDAIRIYNYVRLVRDADTQSSCTAGDIDGNNAVSLSDAVTALQVLVGVTPSANVQVCADVNKDSKIGIQELIYILQKISDTTSEKNAYDLVDTGQKNCYDTDGAAITCSESGEAFYGQDAQFSSSQFNYTDNGDGTVTDNVTGLMWQQSPASNGLSWQEASDYCESLELGGYDDWRIPTLKELFSISDFSQGWPYLDTTYFNLAGTSVSKDEQYWAEKYVGTTVEGQSNAAFGVNHGTGHIKAYPAGVSGPMGNYVRAVRGGTSYGINNFEDNGDGTVTDHATGLMWQKADSGSGMDWENALSYAENSTLAGHGDWRLPNVKELQSIVDYTRSPTATDAANVGPAIDTDYFDITVLPSGTTNYEIDYGYFWSGTSAYFGGDSLEYYYAWYVAFGTAVNDEGADYHGAGGVRFDTKVEGGPLGEGGERYYNYVRLVRGGNVEQSAGDDPDTSDSTDTSDPTDNNNQTGTDETGEQPGPPVDPAGGDAPDLAAAAAILGVSEAELQNALGDPAQGQPDFAAAAAQLGVTEQELVDALGVSPNGLAP